MQIHSYIAPTCFGVIYAILTRTENLQKYKITKVIHIILYYSILAINVNCAGLTVTKLTVLKYVIRILKPIQQYYFYVHVTVHRNKFLYNKTN